MRLGFWMERNERKRERDVPFIMEREGEGTLRLNFETPCEWTAVIPHLFIIISSLLGFPTATVFLWFF